MGKTDNFKEPTYNKNEDKLWGNFYLEEIRNTQTPWVANFCLDELVDLAVRAQEPNTFSKIEGCVNILKENPEKDKQIQEAILETLLNRLYPFLSSEKGSEEIIEQERIDEVANSLGKVMTEHEIGEELYNKYSRVFLENITLNEKCKNEI
jgi:hypothetical protein